MQDNPTGSAVHQLKGDGQAKNESDLCNDSSIMVQQSGKTCDKESEKAGDKTSDKTGEAPQSMQLI